MNSRYEIRYLLGLILATQEYLRDKDPLAGTNIAESLRAIAKYERNNDGCPILATMLESRADDLEDDDLLIARMCWPNEQ